MTPHTSILEKLLVAETAADLGGFTNTKRALTEMIAIERRNLLVHGVGFDEVQRKVAQRHRLTDSRRALGDC